MLEGLENRCFLSSTLNTATGQLTVNGTAGNDVLRIAASVDGKRVLVFDNGAQSSFDTSKVKIVFINGLAGNDTISLRAFAAGQKDLAIRGALSGGTGNDSITGGLGSDTI